MRNKLINFLKRVRIEIIAFWEYMKYLGYELFNPVIEPVITNYKNSKIRVEERERQREQRIVLQAKGEIIDSFEGMILELVDQAISEVNNSGRYNKSFASMEALHHLRVEVIIQLSKLKKQK